MNSRVPSLKIFMRRMPMLRSEATTSGQTRR